MSKTLRKNLSFWMSKRIRLATALAEKESATLARTATPLPRTASTLARTVSTVSTVSTLARTASTLAEMEREEKKEGSLARIGSL